MHISREISVSTLKCNVRCPGRWAAWRGLVLPLACTCLLDWSCWPGSAPGSVHAGDGSTDFTSSSPLHRLVPTSLKLCGFSVGD